MAPILPANETDVYHGRYLNTCIIVYLQHTNMYRLHVSLSYFRAVNGDQLIIYIFMSH